jgi:hypothetical protein
VRIKEVVFYLMGLNEIPTTDSVVVEDYDSGLSYFSRRHI